MPACKSPFFFSARYMAPPYWPRYACGPWTARFRPLSPPQLDWSAVLIEKKEPDQGRISQRILKGVSVARRKRPKLAETLKKNDDRFSSARTEDRNAEQLLEV